MKRPILVVLVGYIIGILWGYTLKISIVFFWLLFGLLFLMQKQIKYHGKNLVKIILNKKTICLACIFSVFSNTIIIMQNYKYENLYKEINEVTLIGIITSNKQETQYKNKYKINIEIINSNKKYKNTSLILYIDKETKNILEYGDKVKIIGEYKEPEVSRNDKGFNQKEYFKSEKIYGIVYAKNVKVLKKKDKKDIFYYLNNVRLKLKENIEEIFGKEIGGILIGFLIGEISDISEENINYFKDSNLYHLLAVSGSHVEYIIIGILLLLEKISIHKKIKKVICILILILFMILTGLSPSVERACIIAILVQLSFIVNRKSDLINTISFSMLIILVENPFKIQNLGFQLSYLGAIGIITLSQSLKINCFNIIKKMNIYNKKKYNENSNEICLCKKKNKILENIKKMIIENFFITVSAQIMIFPIILYNFNTISFTFFISNILASFLIGPITILGFLVFLVSVINIKIASILGIFIKILLKLLIIIAKYTSKIPFSKIYVITPSFSFIIIYFMFIFSYILLKRCKYKRKIIYKKIIIFVNNVFFNYIKYYTFIILIIIIMLLGFKYFSFNIKIHFIDVGQGDSTLIITEKNKKILIDTGGSTNNSSFNVGENILVPYLLNHGIQKIDYVFISHFDSDHSLGCAKIIENIDVSSIILSEQYEENDIYKQIVSMAKKKNIKLIYVKAGNVLNIDGVKLTILHPQKELMVDNAINNNSIVCKMEYKSFSMLFTGDIEKEAEELLLNKNINLKADVLKVAHHRFKNLNYFRFFRGSFS